MKYGVCTHMGNYDDLCKIGYDYIELSGVMLAKMSESEIKNAALKIKQAGIPCHSLNSYCDESLPIVGDNYNAKAVREYAMMISSKAGALGVKMVGIGSPAARKLPDEYDINTANMQAEEFLRITAEVAEEYGILVLFEALNTKMCNYIVHTTDALDMVKRINRDNLKIVLDFYHMSMMNEDINDIAYVMPYVEHLHISGYTPEGQRTYLQTEDVAYYRNAIQSAKNCGYDKTISVEARTSNFFEDASRSLDILKLCDKGEI